MAGQASRSARFRLSASLRPNGIASINHRLSARPWPPVDVFGNIKRLQSIATALRDIRSSSSLTRYSRLLQHKARSVFGRTTDMHPQTGECRPIPHH